MKNIILLIGSFLFITNIQAQAPTVTFTATPSNICAGGSVTFTNTSANNPTLWTWYFPGGSPSSDANSVFPGNPHTAIAYNNPGNYTVTCVVQNASGIDSVIIQNSVTVKSRPDAVIMPPYGGICDISQGKAYDTVFFTLTDTTSGNRYSWAPSASLTCATCNNPGASPINTTVYTLTVTGNSGCSIQLYDTVTAGYIIAEITGKDTICKGDYDTLIASGGSVGGSSPNSLNPQTRYIWSTGDTISSLIVNPMVSTIYSLVIESDECPSSIAIFRIDVQNCSLGIPEIQETFIKVHPNPSNGQFTFVIANPSGWTKQSLNTIEVYNILGEKVYSSSTRADDNSIDLSNQPNGVYLYRVISETGELVGEGKLVVQK